jgi:hypothetical protein
MLAYSDLAKGQETLKAWAADTAPLFRVRLLLMDTQLSWIKLPSIHTLIEKFRRATTFGCSLF